MSVDTEDFFRYLPVSQRAVRWGLYVTGVGCSHVSPAGHHPAAAGSACEGPSPDPSDC